MNHTFQGRRRTALTLAATTAFLTLAGGAAQAAETGELLPYPGPDGVIWVPEQTGSSGFVSGGLSPYLDTYTTFACEGGGSMVVSFTLDEYPDRNPAPFTLTCPEDTPAQVTIPLGPGLHGGFGAVVTTSAPTLRWAATVVQPE
ncbi:hypothetical protein EDD96_3808 [Streptomyces sp. Ag109_G2-6]|uniref:hypothetical protein n=1 Tax=Streptomyces TaxID=1883 RepID=UPI0009A54FED|nr:MULTISPECIES: hypothetical protein [Streptomyces]RPF40055.1 hypothetical protein EDD96_3808 [Streptomyces sp. Ag109_G2-6]